MSGFLVCARLLLAAVFLAAAVGKLVDPAAARRALFEFGAPGSLVEPGVYLLPALELAVAVLLLLAPSARVGALGAALLLLLFVAAMLLALARSEAVECQCFGALHSEPVGVPAIARNMLLAAVAAAVVTQAGQPGIDAWLAGRSAAGLAILALSVALVVSASASASLWRKNRALRRPAVPAAPPPVAVGGRAPAFTADDLAGRPVRLRSLLDARSPIALVFLSPGCGACRTIMADLGRWQGPLQDDLAIHIVSSGDAEMTRAAAGEHHLVNVVLERDQAISRRYGVRGTPAAVIIAPGGITASQVATGPAAIEALIRQALREPAGRGVARRAA